VGEEVRQHAVRAGVLGQPGPLPFLPGAREELDQRGIVDGEQVLVGLRGGLDDRVAGRRERGADRVGARRDLDGRRAHADPQLRVGDVLPVRVAPDQGGGGRHAARA
jgi:hypothetical protein